MTKRADEHVDFSGKLQMLAFTIMGVKLAADTGQIDEMLRPDQAVERGLKIHNFDDRIPFHGRPVIYNSPVVLMINHPSGKTFGIVIDRPDEIISLDIGSIRPLPALLTEGGRSGAIWAAAIKDDTVVLLIDLLKLSVCNPDEAGGGLSD